jgi:hypothetical protein
MIRTGLLLVLLISYLSGCTTFHVHQISVSKQVTVWAEKKQFNKAIEAIEAVPSDHPEYQGLRQQLPFIRQQKRNYIQEVLVEAKQYEDNQDWIKAEQVIQSGLKALPENSELQSQQKHYQDKQAQRAERDTNAILIAKAQYYIDARPYQESRLYNSGHSFSDIQRFNEFEKEADEVSQQLYDIGVKYWQLNKPTQAKEALILAIRASYDESSQELLTKILNNERTRREQDRQKKKKQASDLAPELEQSFKEYLRYGNFTGAQQVLDEMNTLGLPSISQKKENLKRQKIDTANILIASGNVLYNSGLIQEAIKRWKQALILTPENTDLQQQIERAKRFLDNLERWKAPE